MKTVLKFIENDVYIKINDLVDLLITESSKSRPPTSQEIALYLVKIKQEAREKYKD